MRGPLCLVLALSPACIATADSPPMMPLCNVQGPEYEYYRSYRSGRVAETDFVHLIEVVPSFGVADAIEVLQHCPTGQQLVLAVPTGNAALWDQATRQLNDMIYGPESLTLDDMHVALVALGAEAELSVAAHESCACLTHRIPRE